jgi:prevent-host-death family protein
MKTHSAQLLARVNQSRSPVVITQNGEAKAVVVDIKSYERTQDALILLKLISQSEEDFRRGRWKSHKAVEGSVQRKFGI